jgi:hypothetical protein
MASRKFLNLLIVISKFVPDAEVPITPAPKTVQTLSGAQTQKSGMSSR